MPELKIEFPACIGGRIPVLDELKGLAILLFVLYYAGGVLFWQNLLHGDLGVDIFVILSGIGLALSARTEAPVDFMRRRLAPIMPAYWIALTLYWALNSPYFQHHYTPTNIVLHDLGIHAWFGDIYTMSINDSFWFITLIITLSLVFCAVRSLGNNLGRPLFVGGAFSWAFAHAMFTTGQAGGFGHLGLRVPGFFAGLLVGQILREGSPPPSARPAAILRRPALCLPAVCARHHLLHLLRRPRPLGRLRLPLEALCPPVRRRASPTSSPYSAITLSKFFSPTNC